MAKIKITDELHCSFCGRRNSEVKTIISGAEVYICNHCVDISCEIILNNFEIDDALPLLSNLVSSKVGTKSLIEILGVKPRFNKLKFDLKRNQCFYLCPFEEPFNTIYKDHSKPAIESSGFIIKRSDEIFGTQPIIEDIWEAINSSEVIIADVTGKNPNVMYEVGIAHTIGKPVIIITQSIDDVPFDFRHYRCIIYDYTPRGCKELEEKLKGTFVFLKNANT
ncbi:MAG: ClpX C4-type zinc finger protein [Ignavibacteria bacterium]|nr:ClpX C4-type zinc finger protein [Ignavibacteria bacterium]